MDDGATSAALLSSYIRGNTIFYVFTDTSSSIYIMNKPCCLEKGKSKNIKKHTQAMTMYCRERESSTDGKNTPAAREGEEGGPGPP